MYVNDNNIVESKSNDAANDAANDTVNDAIHNVNKHGLNTVDNVTLEFMVNTSQYEKYLKKNNIDHNSGFKRDIRFYRKRIISLTRDLFKNQNENGRNESVDVTMVGAFNMYMRACISYLKFSDQSETIQKCYVCLGITDGQENIKKQTCVCKNKNDNELFELNKANKLCFKPKEVKKITLDNYVIRKNVKKSEPVVYPQQFTFNPRDPEFKYKGLKPKLPSRSQSQPQSSEKMQTESDTHNINELDDDKLNKVTDIENRENGEKNSKDSNEKINENSNEKIKNNRKKKKKKKVSFDVTNYIDNI
jgi:hypothetical protein